MKPSEEILKQARKLGLRLNKKKSKFGNHKTDINKLFKIVNEENERFYRVMIKLLKQIFKLTETEAIEVLYTNILHRMAVLDGSNNRNISSFDEFHDMVGDGVDGTSSNEYETKGYKLDKDMIKNYTQPYKEFKTLEERLPTELARKIILQRINPKKEQRTGSLFNTGYLSTYPKINERVLTPSATTVVSSQRWRPNPIELARQRDIHRGLGRLWND